MNDLSRFATAGEAKFARKLVRTLLDRDYVVSVNDGGEWVVSRSDSFKEITDALCSTGEDSLVAYTKGGERVGWFWLVYGNADNGEELIADYTANDVCEDIWNSIYGVNA